MQTSNFAEKLTGIKMREKLPPGGMRREFCTFCHPGFDACGCNLEAWRKNEAETVQFLAPAWDYLTGVDIAGRGCRLPQFWFQSDYWYPCRASFFAPLPIHPDFLATLPVCSGRVFILDNEYTIRATP
ncbi:MAG: hypothetical protein WCO56_00990 [Verrucomicrobiota bacterium]